MVNPYCPPKSKIRPEVNRSHSKRAWKIFFWTMLLLEVLVITSMLSDKNISLFEKVTDFLIYVVILSGLFGFSYDKKILSKSFWAYLIPVGVSYDIYSLIISGYREFGNFSDLYYFMGFIIVICMPFMILQYFALYKYSYKSDNIWS